MAPWVPFVNRPTRMASDSISLATAQAQLDAYLTAERKILAGQQVEIDGVRLTRANLLAVQSGIRLWSEKVSRLSSSAGGRGRVRNLVVCD